MSEVTTLLTEAFDIDNQEGTPEFELLPKGNYVASITEAQAGPLKTGRGHAVTLRWEIEGGEYSKRTIWDRIIVQHENADAMRIGRQKMKDVCVACQVAGVLTDLAVLRNKPASVYVVIEEDKNGEFPAKNLVQRVRPIAHADSGNGAKPVKAEFNDAIPF